MLIVGAGRPRIALQVHFVSTPSFQKLVFNMLSFSSFTYSLRAELIALMYASGCQAVDCESSLALTVFAVLLQSVLCRIPIPTALCVQRSLCKTHRKTTLLRISANARRIIPSVFKTLKSSSSLFSLVARRSSQRGSKCESFRIISMSAVT